MKNLLLTVLIGFFSFAMLASDADARRFGGGKSFGRSAPTFQKSAPSRTQAAPSQAQRNTGSATSNSRRWLGPMAGLVAGGVLGALLFGDMFEGFQFMDFLLIAGLIFGAIFLFRKLAASKTATAGGPRPQHREAYAGAGASTVSTPNIGSGLGGGTNTNDVNAGVADQRPAWFNEQEFLNAAKQHFVRLQAAWDVADMRDIRDYTTPQLFSELTLERQSYQGEQQFTEVVELNAELLGVTREDDRLVAAVRYSGRIREEQDGKAEPFSETWRIEREDKPDANWLIAGIEQASYRH